MSPQMKILLEVYEKTLLDYGYECIYSNYPVCRFENKDDHSIIEVNRGPSKYYRTTFIKGGRYRFTFEDFDPKLGLKYDILYESVSELQGIFQYFLQATIEHAIPLMKRLPYPSIEITEDVWKLLAQGPAQRAKEWSGKMGVPFAYSNNALIMIQEYINKLRVDDYSKEHFYENIDDIVNMSAFLGEIVMEWRGDGFWSWKKNASSKDDYRIEFRPPCGSFYPLMVILHSWVFTPEFAKDSIEIAIRNLGIALDIITSR